MPTHTVTQDTFTRCNPVDTELDLEELALKAASAKFKAGIEFRLEAFTVLMSIGYDAETAHAIARDLWDEA